MDAEHRRTTGASRELYELRSAQDASFARCTVADDSWRPTLPIEAIPASSAIAMTVERSLEEERYAIIRRSTACRSDISTASLSATLEIADHRVKGGPDLEF